MAQSGQIDLLSLFKQVSKSVKQNKDTLNQADSYNHDHGDHMVEIFDVITQAMKEKKNADPADQLEYAAQILRKKSTSGSGKIYADNLQNAAKQVLGKEINIGTVLTILQALMGKSQKTGTSSSGDLLGSLLGSLMGGGSSNAGADDLLGSLLGQKNGSAGASADDLLGSLLGQLSGNSSGSTQGIDMGDLLGAGMDMLSQTQKGKSGLDALTGALLSGSQMAESDYRQQSGEIVTKAVLGALGSMLQK
jgi:hypothetical protein